MARQLRMLCNKCGRTIDNEGIYFGASGDLRLGYGSKYDGEIARFDLCADCLDRLIDTCKISPIESEDDEAT